jgi:hypothetical protein
VRVGGAESPIMRAEARVVVRRDAAKGEKRILIRLSFKNR